MDSMRIGVGQGKVYLGPQNRQCLEIDNETLESTLREEFPECGFSYNTPFGVLGIARFPSANYLLCISEAEEVGRLNEIVYYRVVRVFPVPLGSHSEGPLMSELKTFLESGSFYFSPGCSITSSFRRGHSEESDYFWNEHLCERIMHKDYLTPLINGYVEIQRLEHFDLGLISRRNKHRSGPRYLHRGLETGHVANSVETEQLLGTRSGDTYKLCTFEQLRGSIPLHWTQTMNFRLAPPIALLHTTSEDFAAHFSSLSSTYNSVSVISLVNKTGREQALGEAYTELLSTLSPPVQFTWFDLHQEFCNVQSFVGSLEASWTELDLTVGTLPDKQQTGTFRVNCIDCLDRTNVMQYFIGNSVLTAQLPDAPESLRAALKTLYVKNGDSLSSFYAGTPAQKTELILSGKRSLLGALKDGQLALRRYYTNHFLDSHRKNVTDLLLGSIRPQKLPSRRLKGLSVLLTLSASLFFSYKVSKSSSLQLAAPTKFSLAFIVTLPFFALLKTRPLLS